VSSRAIICDIDGTLSDNRYRRVLLRQKPPKWKEFLAGAVNDKPNLWVVELLHSLSQGYPILLVTGRDEGDRTMTETWLSLYNVPYDRMWMRTLKDYRSDPIIKKEILNAIRAEYEPWLALDDRPDTIKMWRENNIPCLDCNFDDEAWGYPQPGNKKFADNAEWLDHVGQQNKDDRFSKAADELRQLRAKLDLLERSLGRDT
jgi:Zn ribbon nucleic-acid-binding protein